MLKYNIKAKVLIASFVSVVWFFGMIFAFWFFQFKNLRQFSENPELGLNSKTILSNFNSSEIKNSIRKMNASAVVINFIDPECYCSKFTLQHVKKIQNKYSHDKIIFTDAYRDAGEKGNFIAKNNMESSELYSVIRSIINLSDLPATPAVAVFDGEGNLAYFGPYSDDAFCGTSDGFLDNSIKKILAGQNYRDVNMLAYGCFCESKML